MKFFFCGGSNTDYEATPLKISELYPDIVSKHFNATYVNLGGAAASNKRTIRKIFYDYNMEDYDLICIDFTPRMRTEFYDTKHKKWERITVHGELPKNSELFKLYWKRINVHGEFSKNLELCKLYYENFYNDEYGSIIQNIQFNIIKRYLKALNKPHLIFNSENIKNKNKNLNFDIQFVDCHIDTRHLSLIGHKQVAKHIIKYYENYLQRGQLDLGI